MAQIKPAAKRNLLRTAIIMVVYMSGIFAAKYLIGDRGVTGPPAFAFALVPSLALAAIFWTSAKSIEETEDEFMRMLAVRQNLIAAGFAMAVASAWGTLEMFELVPHVAAFYIVLLWAVGIFIGLVVNRITHGVWGQCP
jgi:hypothetical protein